jgi:hypothetical protein
MVQENENQIHFILDVYQPWSKFHAIFPVVTIYPDFFAILFIALSMLVVSLENQTNMSGFLMVGQFFLTI